MQAKFIERHLGGTPNDGNAWGDLGVIYARRSDFGRAENAFARYIALEPENPNAYFRMGVLLVMKKNYRKAREQFQKTIYLDPIHIEALLYLSKLNLLHGDKTAAVKYLRQILKAEDNREARELLRRIEQGG